MGAPQPLVSRRGAVSWQAGAVGAVRARMPFPYRLGGGGGSRALAVVAGEVNDDVVVAGSMFFYDEWVSDAGFKVWFFFFNDAAPPEIYTLPLRDARPFFPAVCDGEFVVGDVGFED